MENFMFNNNDNIINMHMVVIINIIIMIIMVCYIFFFFFIFTVIFIGLNFYEKQINILIKLIKSFIVRNLKKQPKFKIVAFLYQNS